MYFARNDITIEFNDDPTRSNLQLVEQRRKAQPLCYLPLFSVD